MPCQSQKELRKYNFQDVKGISTRATMRCALAGSNSMPRQRFIRRFMRVKSKLMNHKDAAFKRAGKRVMKTTLLHKPIPIPQAMKIPDAKAAVVWDILKNLPAWRMVIEQQAQKTERRSILQRLLTVVILRIRSWKRQFHKYKGRVVLRRPVVQ